MSLNECLQRDASVMLDDFGETVTYKPASGDSRSIAAVIDRLGPQQLPGGMSGNSPAFSVLVANSLTSGIASAEIDPAGGDRISLATHYGGSAVDRQIIQVLSQDPGMLELLVQ